MLFSDMLQEGKKVKEQGAELYDFVFQGVFQGGAHKILLVLTIRALLTPKLKFGTST
jgi:hypothetical protein